MEKNLPLERRPVWFLKNYFKTKCCRIPPFINTTILTECGFSSLMQYYTHAPQYGTTIAYPMVHFAPIQAPPTDEKDKVHVVDLNDVTEAPEDVTDPLECCNVDEFIKPAWRSECQFELTWNDQSRLSIVDKPAATTPAPSTTHRPARERDIMVVPQSCEQETCVFKKLNIISDSGAVDMDAFLKLLDNFTDAQPTWMKAKARVVTTCLTKPLRDYDAECDINNVLACTFDVLTEKHRRDTCFLPEIVSREVLTECGLKSLTRVEQAPETPVVNRKKTFALAKYSCIDQTPPTGCLMGKMGVLSRYGFMDHFQMKDRIRKFSNGFDEWKPWTDVYLGAFTNIPLYRDYCNSPKKLLNLLDAMIMTCPVSRRKDTPQCAKVFTEMTHSIPVHEQNITKVKLDRILNHFHHVFWPVSTQGNHASQKHYKIVKKPIYDYGILKSKNEPKVQIIDVKPVPKKPLVLVPVYLRLPAQNNLSRPYANDGVWRSNPFWLHTQIALAHLNTTTTASANPTIATKTTTPTA
ncbi:odorant binding protein 26 [Manduca sexta]|uniref:Odorant binding protein 26 n=1 Tax=Manduca sexta TaxID=7130 RepID=A0A921YZH0_MANSE|nr:odorant binding protein 26 [Manduca sexta]